MSILH